MVRSPSSLTCAELNYGGRHCFRAGAIFQQHDGFETLPRGGFAREAIFLPQSGRPDYLSQES
jgi:hypothetical protein